MNNEISIFLEELFAYFTLDIQSMEQANFFIQKAKEATSYYVKNYQWTEAYKLGKWDGKKHLGKFHRKQNKFIFPAGLLPQVKELFERHKIQLNIHDCRNIPMPVIPPTQQLDGITLRPYQERLIQSITDLKTKISDEKAKFYFSGVGIQTPYRVPGHGIWWSATGCHAKGQLILMYDRTLKPVEYIKVDDLLMGPDGQPRRVLQLYQGKQLMVKICPEKYEPFIVNIDHILTLIYVKGNKKYLIDISVRKYLSWPKSKQKKYKLFTVDINSIKEKQEYSFDELKTGRRYKITNYISFYIERLNIDEYYGFKVDKEGRYVIKNNIVTHNSGKTEAAAGLIGRLGIKTLFLVFGNDLVQQAYNRFERRLGSWLKAHNKTIGIASEGSFEPGFITVASVQTLSARLNRSVQMLNKLQESLEYISNLLVNSSLNKTEQSLGLKAIQQYQNNLKILDKSKLYESVTILQDLIFDGYKHIKRLLDFPEQYPHAIRERESIISFLSNIQLLIQDEAHQAAADTAYELLMNCPAYYRIGMSGTPLARSDGANLKVIAALGEVVGRVTNKEMVQAKVIPKARIHIVPIITPISKYLKWPKCYNEGIVFHRERNNKIINIIYKAIQQNRKVLVLFQYLAHGDELSRMLLSSKNNEGERIEIPHRVLTGKDSKDVRNYAIQEISSGQLQVLLANDIFQQGIDIPAVDVVINAAGGKALIPVLQRLGRGLRGSNLDMYDFADGQHKTLAKHSLQRLKIYQNENCFQILVDKKEFVYET